MATERPVTRVLVVDDEESQRTALASMIKLWGYGVETAADGQEALEKLVSFGAHVIITDLNMPRMSGQELLKRLKEDGDAPPVIVQTAYGSLETSVSMVHDLGAFWFLEKPVQSQALRLLLERAAAQEKLAEHAERLERQLSNQGVLCEMVGSSHKMREVFSLVQQVAGFDEFTLLHQQLGLIAQGPGPLAVGQIAHLQIGLQRCHRRRRIALLQLQIDHPPLNPQHMVGIQLHGLAIVIQRNRRLAQGFIVFAQPALGLICGLGSQARGQTRLFDNLLVIRFQIDVLELLQIIHRLSQQQMDGCLMIAI